MTGVKVGISSLSLDRKELGTLEDLVSDDIEFLVEKGRVLSLGNE